MRAQDIAPYPSGHGVVAGTYVADGYGIRVYVRNKHLIVADGFADRRREQRFHKVTGGLQRLVVLGHTGYITFEAFRWMTDAGVSYLQLDRDGVALATAEPPGTSKAEVRRAQALAFKTHTGIALTRWVLDAKLRGQSKVVQRLSSDASNQIDVITDSLDDVTGLDELRWLEASAARVYWEQWNRIPMEFVTKQRKVVPDHWSTIGTRRPGAGMRAKSASNPGNAILNYLYALLEGQVALACTVAGLDPGVGILHSDRGPRRSLVLDLMEAVRPDVDEYVLDLLEGHVFRVGDFRESRLGVCRINPPLTHQLASTATLWYELAAPVVEQALHVITDGRDATTPLTQRNRRKVSAREAQPPPPKAVVRIHCLECGADTTPVRKLCDRCRDSHRSDAWHSRLSQLRADGADPAHGGYAAERRGETNRGHQLAVAAWNGQHDKPGPKWFEEMILSRLQSVKIEDIAAATGLSLGYCSFIRRGMKIPHPRHWPTFLDLVAEIRPNQEPK